MRALFLIFMSAVMSGCMAPAITYDHNRVLAEDGGDVYSTRTDTINRPYSEVKNILEETAPRCLNRHVNDGGVTTDRFVRFYAGATNDSLVLTYLIKGSGMPDSEAVNVLVTTASKQSGTTTTVKTYYYDIMFLGNLEAYAGVLMEWVHGEHELCLN